VKTLFIQNNGIQESIGVANLSGILKANGHDTDLLLVSHTRDLIGAIKKYDPGLIAFSALTGVHHSIEKLAVTIKRQINELLGSAIVEEKSYRPYNPQAPGKPPT